MDAGLRSEEDHERTRGHFDCVLVLRVQDFEAKRSMRKLVAIFMVLLYCGCKTSMRGQDADKNPVHGQELLFTNRFQTGADGSGLLALCAHRVLATNSMNS